MFSSGAVDSIYFAMYQVSRHKFSYQDLNVRGGYIKLLTYIQDDLYMFPLRFIYVPVTLGYNSIAHVLLVSLVITIIQSGAVSFD